MSARRIEHRDSPIVVDADPSSTSDYDALYEPDSDLIENVKPVLIKRVQEYCSQNGIDWPIEDDEAGGTEFDICHFIYLLRLGGEFYKSPIDENPENIIDVKAAPGIWAKQMAEKFPDASVVGTDITSISLSSEPNNVTFKVDKLDDRLWQQYDSDHFDFIRTRDAAGVIRRWDNFVKGAFKALKPGGWYEIQETSVEICSEEGGSMSRVPSGISSYVNNFIAAYNKMGMLDVAAPEVVSILEDEGFVDIVQHSYKLPIGIWPEDPVEKEIGAFQLFHLLTTLEWKALSLLHKNLLMSEEESGEMIEKLMAALKNRKNHLYTVFWVTYGRKPE